MENPATWNRATQTVEPEIWLSQTANLLNLYLNDYCPKDVARDLLQKIAENWPNMLDEIASSTIPTSADPSPKEREFCEWMIGFNSDPKFVQEFTTRFINACNERVLKGGYPTHFSELKSEPPSTQAVRGKLSPSRTYTPGLYGEAARLLAMYNADELLKLIAILEGKE